MKLLPLQVHLVSCLAVMAMALLTSNCRRSSEPKVQIEDEKPKTDLGGGTGGDPDTFKPDTGGGGGPPQGTTGTGAPQDGDKQATDQLELSTEQAEVGRNYVLGWTGESDEPAGTPNWKVITLRDPAPPQTDTPAQITMSLAHAHDVSTHDFELLFAATQPTVTVGVCKVSAAATCTPVTPGFQRLNPIFATETHRFFRSGGFVGDEFKPQSTIFQHGLQFYVAAFDVQNRKVASRPLRIETLNP